MLNNMQVTNIVNYIMNNSNYTEFNILLVVNHLENLSLNLFTDELNLYCDDICDHTNLPIEDVHNIIELFSVALYIYVEQSNYELDNYIQQNRLNFNDNDYIENDDNQDIQLDLYEENFQDNSSVNTYNNIKNEQIFYNNLF